MSRGPIGGIRRIGAFLAAVVCLSLAGAAQQRPATPPQATFRTDIELVQIDAVVVDERGRHVRGLKAADFLVRDRGRPQTVAAFEEIAHARVESNRGPAAGSRGVRLDVASNQTASADRLIVVVVDDLHIWRGRTDTAKTIARGILEKLGPDASMAVLFTSGERSTQVTEDRSILLDAIDTFKGRQSVRRPNQAIDSQRPRPNDPEASMETQLGNIQASQDVSLQQFADNMNLFSTLEDAARMMGAGDARRKAFVLISEGMQKNPIGLFQGMRPPGQAPEGGAEYAATGDPGATIIVSPLQYHDYALIDMMESMRRSNVATYAIDPRGEVTSQDLALELHPAPIAGDPIFRWHNPLRMAQDGLTTVAEASGGFAVVDTDDFTSGLERILDDLDHYYLLGFYPADPKRKGYRLLDVSLPAHPTWTVRFRKGYRTEGAPKPPANSNPLVALSAGVLPRTDLALRLNAIPLAAGAGSDTRVALALEVSVPRERLQDADGKLRDELTYEILAVNEDRKKVTLAGGLTARVTLSPAVPGGPLPDVAAYQVTDAVTLAPGRYQLRVSAQSQKLAAGGSVYLNVDVPDFRKAADSIGGIAIGYAEGARVASAAAAAPAPPLPFAPTLDREFATADLLRIYFEVAARADGATAAGMLEIVDADEGAVQSSMTFTPDDRGRVDVQVPLADLPSGAYVLRATYTAADATARREVGFVIR